MGYEPGKDDDIPEITAKKRLKILEELDEGIITADVARRLLQGEE
jgi:hypothetical protein